MVREYVGKYLGKSDLVTKHDLTRQFLEYVCQAVHTK